MLTVAANERQVGGTHYKGRTTEPWDYIEQHNLDFFLGNIVKYVTRFSITRNKDDLEKARHYLEKKLERIILDEKQGQQNTTPRWRELLDYAMKQEVKSKFEPYKWQQTFPTEGAANAKAAYTHINLMPCTCGICRDYERTTNNNKTGNTNNNA